MSVTLNGLLATSVRFTIPWKGMWVAHVELDITDVALVPMSGPAILIAGNTVCKGIIDPRGSGNFNTYTHCRVIGGDWDKEVPPQHFHNAGGALTSTEVYAATAAAIKELPPIDPTPQLFGTHFGRVRGAASRVFGNRDWHVDPVTSTVLTGPWPTSPFPSDVQFIDFDIDQQRGTFAGDTLLLPGMLVTDDRLNGRQLVIRDVEQTFDKNGGNAEVWFSDNPITRLQSAFAVAVREFAGTGYLRTYKYRFVVPEAGGELALQAITEGAPDLNPIAQWTGLSGISASLAGQAALAPATEIVVGFIGGDPTQPYLAAFSPLAKPLGITLDATTFIDVGVPTSFVALANLVDANFAALNAWLTAHVHPTGVGPSGQSPGVPPMPLTASTKLRSQ